MYDYYKNLKDTYIIGKIIKKGFIFPDGKIIDIGNDPNGHDLIPYSDILNGGIITYHMDHDGQINLRIMDKITQYQMYQLKTKLDFSNTIYIDFFESAYSTNLIKSEILRCSPSLFEQWVLNQRKKSQINIIKWLNNELNIDFSEKIVKNIQRMCVINGHVESIENIQYKHIKPELKYIEKGSDFTQCDLTYDNIQTLLNKNIICFSENSMGDFNRRLPYAIYHFDFKNSLNRLMINIALDY